jgi:hypothetical protein
MQGNTGSGSYDAPQPLKKELLHLQKRLETVNHLIRSLQEYDRCKPRAAELRGEKPA